MDPNATMDMLIEAVSDFHKSNDSKDKLDAAERMADAIEALDGWITRGGFLPKRWSKQ